MATILNKDITRESTVKAGDRELLITLTADQKITMKPKGLGNANTVEISIDELYDQLNGAELGNNKKAQRYPDDLLIPINELRSEMLSSDLDYSEKVKFSNFVRNVINNVINRIKSK